MTQDDGKLEDLLADLWQRHLPQLRERLDILDRTAAEASTGNLPEASRLEAQSIAHKLSGNLGMFGHHAGSEIASTIEHILKTPTPETLTALTGLTKSLRDTLTPHLQPISD
jgi:HPt (histidine-containing phosphotransfer) domain-containing protein